MFSGFGGFGGDNKQPNDSKENQTSTKSNASNLSTTANSNSQYSGFDPTGLERAAKAAKELDSSKNSQDAISLIKSQELTKQREMEMERAKYMAMQQELGIKRAKEEELVALRTLEKQSQHYRNRADYRDELEHKRMIDQINAQRRLHDEERKKNEDSLLRQEQTRRRTLEYEAELRQKTELARVKAETSGKIQQERENHDLLLEKKRLEMQEYRETILESIKLAGTTFGAGIQIVLSDRQQLVNIAGAVTAIAFGLYTAKTSIGVTGRAIEARLGKPSLVRETSKLGLIQFLKHPVSTSNLYLRRFTSSNADNAMQSIVLSGKLENRLKRISLSTFNTTQNRAPYRHLLLHGPPGTGKTMFAKGLAKASGMHYAIMTGGDIAPLGKDAVTEIHKLFDWANSTSKGVLIFIDEADAFLRKRSTEKISEDMRNALNAFLYRTGESSKKFMIVYASNQPEQFDWAINDRIDELIEFHLPGYEERVRMIKQYMEDYILNNIQGSKQITVIGLDDELIQRMAELTEGYSGREISKLAIAWQAAAYGNENANLDAEVIQQVLIENKQSKSQKQKWLSKEEIQHLTSNS